MGNIFWYRREITRKVKEEKPEGADDKWLPLEKEVTETYWDCFNVNKVVRGHWTKEDEFTVYLDDGHEQADDVQKPKFNAKMQVVGVETKRERAWYMSQVPMCKQDALRFRAMTEKAAKEIDYSTLA